MISIYELKPAFQKLLRPFSNWLVYCGVTPNIVTITAVVFSLLEGLFISIYPDKHWPLLLLPVILLIRMILNAIDGMIAREHQMQSALGTFLNELGDVFSDTFLYLPLALVPNISPVLIIFIVILAIIAEMTGVIAIQAGSKRHYEGPMGKSDRAFIFGAIGLLLGFGIQANFWINMIFFVMIILLAITIINRIVQALKDIRYDA